MTTQQPFHKRITFIAIFLSFLHLHYDQNLIAMAVITLSPNFFVSSLDLSNHVHYR